MKPSDPSIFFNQSEYKDVEPPPAHMCAAIAPVITALHVAQHDLDDNSIECKNVLHLIEALDTLTFDSAAEGFVARGIELVDLAEKLGMMGDIIGAFSSDRNLPLLAKAVRFVYWSLSIFGSMTTEEATEYAVELEGPAREVAARSPRLMAELRKQLPSEADPIEYFLQTGNPVDVIASGLDLITTFDRLLAVGRADPRFARMMQAIDAELAKPLTQV